MLQIGVHYCKGKRDTLEGKEKRENENFGVSSEVVRRTNVTCAPEPLQKNRYHPEELHIR